MELLKQDDSDTRTATASLIDELSLGVAFTTLSMRVGTEISYLLHSKSTTYPLHPLRNLVWTKLSYVLGLLHPTNPHWDDLTQLAIQKAFF